jgi:hypothetical protein
MNRVLWDFIVLFIYVRTYEPCLVSFYVFLSISCCSCKKKYLCMTNNATKRKVKEISHIHWKNSLTCALKIFTHLCIQGWSCALKRFTHLCIDIFYLWCNAWVSHVNSRNLTYASKKFTCAFKKFTCAFKKITRALEDHFYNTNMRQQIYDHACI